MHTALAEGLTSKELYLKGETMAVVDEGVEEKVEIKLPDWKDEEAVKAFSKALKEYTDKRGVKTLIKWHENWNMHMRLANAAYEHMQASAAYVNGHRLGHVRGMRKHSLKVTAQKFYESLPTAALRSQCSLFDLDYNSYESQEDIIAALVAKHLEMIKVA